MRNKGFTILEMVIVLIVIGLVVGLATSAINVAYNARLRSELLKINKIQNAAILAYDMHPNFTEYMVDKGVGESVDMIDSLVNLGLLGDDDTYLSSMIYNSSDNQSKKSTIKYNLYTCGVRKIDANDLTPPSMPNPGSGATGGITIFGVNPSAERGESENFDRVALCISAVARPYRNNAFTLRMPANIVCAYEDVKDDNDLRTGSGRGVVQAGDSFIGNKFNAPGVSSSDINFFDLCPKYHSLHSYAISFGEEM